MLKAIVVDDVDELRSSLIDFLTKYCPEIKVVAEAGSVNSAVEKIRNHQPDIVFLDIDLPDGTGFDILNQLNTVTFKIIFITAYNEHAIQAFKYSAVDYLVKPVNIEELTAAVNKTISIVEKENIGLKLHALFSNMDKTTNVPRKLILKTAERIYSINIPEIIRCESHGGYTQFYLNDGKKLLVSTTIKEYDTMLSPRGFFRVHQSHLINLHYFDHYLKANGGEAIMKDKSSIPVSVRKKDAFLTLIEKL